MTGVDGPTPAYISSHSAEVILSDIRPIKLRVEALQSINVLLDEILYSILSAAHSLTTDKLRAGLLSILPTPLGKEALLEAEVELRAYLDNNTSRDHKNKQENDRDTFHLQWAFELLRLKCEAYSTLNESDEDPSTEPRLQERMRFTGATAPSVALVAPAALYLTAILESLCEHILSNVGRVASRDSSRATATVNDLFVALCEDETFYGFFRTMRVYEQIETMSKPAKTRRSKSISRNERSFDTSTAPVSRTSSPLVDRNSPTPPSRKSIETSASRSSFDKARNMKRYLPSGRNSASHDREGENMNQHTRTDSNMSEETKLALASAYDGYEDPNAQEFDNLMKSGSTMKVSLTPDRLRTMEVYRKEKNGHGPPMARTSTSQLPNNPASSSNHDNNFAPPALPPPPPIRAAGRRPSLAQVQQQQSIVEDDEDTSPRPSSATRNGHAPPPLPTSQQQQSGSLRSRASSMSSKLVRKSSRSGLAAPPPSSFPQSPPPPPPVLNTSTSSFGKTENRSYDTNVPPMKTRRIQKNRESLDLDDIMNGSDDDNFEGNSSFVEQSSVPVTPTRSERRGPAVTPKVSSRTRELLDFLDEGPPETGPTGGAGAGAGGNDMKSFLNDGPPDHSLPTSPSLNESTRGGKATKRLQRMISKLSLGGGDKSDSSPRGIRTRNISMSSNMSSYPPTLNNKASSSTLSPLANRPIPPRPHLLASPTSPGSDEYYGNATVGSRPRGTTINGFSEKAPSRQQSLTEFGAMPPPSSTSAHRTAALAEGFAPRPTISRTASSDVEENRSRILKPVKVAEPEVSHIAPKPKPVKTIPAAIQTAPTPSPATAMNEDAKVFRQSLARATSVEECRMLLDLFFAKTGLLPATVEEAAPYPSPSPSVHPAEIPSYTSDETLERQVIELLLGDPSLSRKATAGIRVIEPASVVV